MFSFGIMFARRNEFATDAISQGAALLATSLGLSAVLRRRGRLMRKWLLSSTTYLGYGSQV
jgi:hypothetical protein